MLIIKIGFRNVIKNWKRSLLISIALFIPCLIMILTNSAFNGAEEQVLKSYINIQVGEVAVMWSNVMEYERDRPERIFYSHFDLDKEDENKKELNTLYEYIERNGKQIKAFFPTIQRGAALFTNKKKLDVFVYSLTKDSAEFMQSTGTLKMEKGELSIEDDRGVYISSQYAAAFELNIGDEIYLDCNTIYGARNRLDFIIKGIYANSPGWLNSTVYMSDKSVREFYDFDDLHFNICRIYFHNTNDAFDFASKLNSELSKYGTTLVAEHYLEASTFYPNFVNSQRNFYAAFSIFLFFVIALGIRSTVRMNIFERMGEFATLRAIGYSRFRTFLIIFIEIILLTIFSLIAAFIIAFIITMIFKQNGVYVGTGPISYMFGGDRFFPVIRINDVISLMLILFLLSIYSPLKPGLSLCYQKIADILIKKQKRFFIIPMLIKNLFMRIGLMRAVK